MTRYVGQFPGQDQQIQKLILFARKIAQHQRGETHLRPHEALKIRLLCEYAELEEALATKDRIDVLSEVADCIYYNTCLFALDSCEPDLHEVNRFIAHRAGICVETAYIVALAKYQSRSVKPNSKDFEAERIAIQKALESVRNPVP